MATSTAETNSTKPLSEKAKDRIVTAGISAVVAAVASGAVLLISGAYTRLVVPENAIVLVEGECTTSGWKEARWLHGKYARFEIPSMLSRVPLSANDKVKATLSDKYFLDNGKQGDRRSQQIPIVDMQASITPDFYGLTPCVKKSI